MDTVQQPEPDTAPAGDVADQLLTGPEVAQLLGISPITWRTYVIKRYAPAPDVPGTGKAGADRYPKWKVSTVAEYRRTRRGQGHRSDLK